MEFPMYLSLALNPGYDTNQLAQFGFEGEYKLFQGNVVSENETTSFSWNFENLSIKGRRCEQLFSAC